MAAFAGFLGFMCALMVLMTTRTPVAVALGVIGIVGTAVFVSPNALQQIANIAFTQSSSFVLIVVPLFVLMGEALASTGVGNDLFRAAQMWLRRLPGALAVGTVFACAVFAAVCGSSPVTAATIGSMAVPEMIKRGYDKSLALGTAAAGGTLGILIPPSIPMIIYGVLTETSIGDLFIAGILPGIMMAFLFSATVILKVWFRPELAPPLKERTPWPVKWRALGSVLPVLVLAFLVIGSIYRGAATPTEAGAVGAAGAIAIAAVMGYLSWSNLRRMLDATVRTTAMFLLLFVGGLFSSFVLTRLGVPQGMSNFLTSLDVPPWVIIVMINLLLLVLGMFLDPTSILVIIVPIFFKSVIALGYDPVWFGVMVTIQIEIAAITPPVGFNLFVLKSVVPGVEMMDVVRGSLIFIIPLLLGIVLLMLFPQIALFLPSLVKSEQQLGRAYSRTAVLRADGPQRTGDGVRASQPDGSVVLDLPDGALLHLVPLHRHRSAGLRALAQGGARPDHGRSGPSLLGGDRRGAARRTRHSGGLLGRLLDRALHASPASGPHRGYGAVWHRLHAGQGVRSAPHQGLHRARHRLSLGLHLRGSRARRSGQPRWRATSPTCSPSATRTPICNRSSTNSRRWRSPTPRIIMPASPARPSSSAAARTSCIRPPSP